MKAKKLIEELIELRLGEGAQHELKRGIGDTQVLHPVAGGPSVLLETECRQQEALHLGPGQRVKVVLGAHLFDVGRAFDEDILFRRTAS